MPEGVAAASSQFQEKAEAFFLNKRDRLKGQKIGCIIHCVVVDLETRPGVCVRNVQHIHRAVLLRFHAVHVTRA
eukprot:2551286-Amphidinium_carterae.1